ncbi:hypothetical protein ACLKA6_008974 [Drosophila palustris]
MSKLPVKRRAEGQGRERDVRQQQQDILYYVCQHSSWEVDGEKALSVVIIHLEQQSLVDLRTCLCFHLNSKQLVLVG